MWLSFGILAALIGFVLSQETEFAVIIDAGTTGTRIWVYKWSTADNNKIKPTVEGSAKASTPLGNNLDYAQNMTAIVGYLINQVKSKVPSDKQKDTSIYVYATSVFRLMPAGRASSMLDALRTYLQSSANSPFKFDAARNARILEGSEEAVMAWLTLNYAAGFKPAGSTLGVLSLFSAATQITFTTNSPILDGLETVTADGQIYPLYARAHLRYGQQYIAIMVREKLVTDNPDQTSIENPCQLKGEDLSEGGKTFSGTGNAAQCTEILDKLMFKELGNSVQCYPKPCSIGSVYQPALPSGMVFYAIEGFYKSLLTLKLKEGSDVVFNVNDLYNQAASLCSNSIVDIRKTLNQPEDLAEFISPSCLTIIYMKSLFGTGYGFDLSTIQIHAAESINGISTDYTLGAAIYENSLKTPAGGGKGVCNVAPSLAASATTVILLAVTSGQLLRLL